VHWPHFQTTCMILSSSLVRPTLFDAFTIESPNLLGQ
jgi:hypothetical protein